MIFRRRSGFVGTCLGALALAAGSAALADVKAGVDAWTRGDYARAVKEWAAPAKAGDPDAQFNLAQAYRLGRGVETDTAKAEALYAAAAAKGHVKAADNYGLLLFQGGKRERALPYLEAAAGRGDPRAQYLLGIAHFNGDLVAKDWPRAYALMTLANAVGLPQAKAALQQMDDYIPLDQRQQAQALAAQLKSEADAARSRDLAAVDLALAGDSPTGPVVASRQAGADFTGPKAADTATEALARQAVVVAAAAPTAPVAKPATPRTAPAVAQPTPAAPRPVATTPASGPWKLQLGSFGVPGNADKLWSSLASRREIAGHAKIKAASGKFTVLYAGGFATQADAAAACAGLRKTGQACLVTR